MPLDNKGNHVDIELWDLLQDAFDSGCHAANGEADFADWVSGVGTRDAIALVERHYADLYY